MPDGTDHTTSPLALWMSLTHNSLMVTHCCLGSGRRNPTETFYSTCPKWTSVPGLTQWQIPAGAPTDTGICSFRYRPYSVQAAVSLFPLTSKGSCFIVFKTHSLSSLRPASGEEKCLWQQGQISCAQLEKARQGATSTHGVTESWNHSCPLGPKTEAALWRQTQSVISHAYSWFNRSFTRGLDALQ